MPRLGHAFQLGLKELISLRYDVVLLVFVIYAFTVEVIVFARGSWFELRNASIAIVDEDQSPLSFRIGGAFLEPRFQPPEMLSLDQIDPAMDAGRYTFVVDIPPDFQADLLVGRRPRIQVNVDATAVSQAYIGALYVRRILLAEITEYLRGTRPFLPEAVNAVVRVKFNPNLESHWFVGVVELLMTVTMISILVPGAAVLREREHGTLGHLLVMPLTPAEIVLAKVWASSLVVLGGTALSMRLVVEGFLHVPVAGSTLLFLLGTMVFQLAAAGLGVFLATITRSIPQLGLVSIMIMVPMMFLSGAWAPLETMPPWLQSVMQLSPVTHYVDFTGAILFRGATLTVVWPHLVVLAGIAATLLGAALLRFRTMVSTAPV
jgi:ABC-2 type transport system permease protein